MNDKHGRVTDVYLSDQFWSDYNRLDSEQVKKAIDKYLDVIGKTGECPPGFKPRRAKGTNYFIGNLGMGRRGWRLLYFMNGSTMLWDRIVDHETRDEILKELVK